MNSVGSQFTQFNLNDNSVIMQFLIKLFLLKSHKKLNKSIFTDAKFYVFQFNFNETNIDRLISK